MAAPSLHAAALAVAGNSQFPTKELSALPSNLPKSARILKNAEYRKVYDNGVRLTCPFFAVFCLRRDAAQPIQKEPGPDADAPSQSLESRFGFTTPRALGKAVIRNRIKRRMKEAIRLRREQLNPGWDIVFNPRRSAQTAPFPTLLVEVERIFRKCNG
jgi:ribonuclease P protein component